MTKILKPHCNTRGAAKILKSALVVGGTSGLGLAIALQLMGRGYDNVYIIGREPPNPNTIDGENHQTSLNKLIHIPRDLSKIEDLDLANLPNVSTLVYSAGIGRIASFESLGVGEIQKLISVNQLSFFYILKRYYETLSSNMNFECSVISSIAGELNSPLFSVYAATKSAVNSFVEAINIELEKNKTKNRILNVLPGRISGTPFHGTRTYLDSLEDISSEIVERMMRKETKWIPEYNETYKAVLQRYQDDPVKFGLDSYDYKISMKDE